MLLKGEGCVFETWNGFLLILGLLITEQFWAQSENKPLQRSIEVDHKQIPLKGSQEQCPPWFFTKDFLWTPPTQQSPKSFERDIQMGESEAFLDRGEEF